MYRQFRPILPGEFIIVGGDCSQGGKDYNCAQFLSVTHNDVPLIYHSRGVAAAMTSALFPVLEKIADRTGVKPVVGLERSMGGASEMVRLQTLNRLEKYQIFIMPAIGSTQEVDSNKLGVETTALTRPIYVGGLKQIVDINGLAIYDKATLDELAIFIENNNGKPEAAPGGHDDTVMSLAIAWFMRQYVQPILMSQRNQNSTVVTRINDDPY